MRAKFARAQRNALRWPIVAASQRALTEHAHAIGQPAALHHAFTPKGEACARLMGGFRVSIIVDAASRPPTWLASALVGENTEPLQEAVPRRAWSRQARKMAVRLLRQALDEVGVPASEGWEDVHLPGRSPMSLALRKALTPEEAQQVERELSGARARWRRVVWRERWAQLRERALRPWRRLGVRLGGWRVQLRAAWIQPKGTG